MAKYESEQQKLNARARTIGHRIENLSTAGSYRVHNTNSGEYYIVTKNSALQQLITQLENEHGAR